MNKKTKPISIEVYVDDYQWFKSRHINVSGWLRNQLHQYKEHQTRLENIDKKFMVKQ